MASNYTSRSSLDSFWGSANIDKWADKNNTEDADEISTAVDLAIATAEQEIHDQLRDGPYTLPLTGIGTNALKTAQHWATVLAGEYLYASRGLPGKESKEGSHVRAEAKRVRHQMREVLAGIRRMDAVLSHSKATAPSPVV